MSFFETIEFSHSLPVPLVQEWICVLQLCVCPTLPVWPIFLSQPRPFETAHGPHARRGRVGRGKWWSPLRVQLNGSRRTAGRSSLSSTNAAAALFNIFFMCGIMAVFFLLLPFILLSVTHEYYSLFITNVQQEISRADLVNQLPVQASWNQWLTITPSP